MAYPATLFGVDTDADLEKLASQLSKFSLFRSEIEFLGKKFQLGLKIENMEKSQKFSFINCFRLLRFSSQDK
ncbi:hypothetical protein TCARB_0259 [Thermofilum adornatum 1505]|uniref:Uncharacterized protein n=1 Tax=Thermofilum adornatum 1505 TaxID=697581 RepID=A0A3G1A5P0_9CREN|nr:hypothetical protein TCARB_0259 [Thermofilum adornatum 1505]